MRPVRTLVPLLPFLVLAATVSAAVAPRQIAGIDPRLAMFNEGAECGTGAVVPWADRLWVITYSPHSPKGSSDKLYEITPDRRQIIRPESIGGTPANRFIHRESRQLFIGPYAIDAAGQVRVIPYTAMFGRPTGTARHLLDPANKVYTASMEEGLYEVDVHTLAVTELFRDEAQPGDFRRAALPGYHGKGLYSGQGVLVYANNGEHGTAARTRPETPSGVLASWDGRADAWTVVRRNQFTEVTGPGGLMGNASPATDPLWTIGWDHRSLILMVLEAGRWHAYRLPKSSHSYDGAHGWNTEWPRIREIGEDDLLMTMHGAFWRFPRGFAPGKSAGLTPRSNYLKVIGDFARWGDQVVFGCDDTARSEFLNKRRAKGTLAAPGQSQSNLWFVAPAELDRLGPVLGRGAVWLEEPVRAGVPSDPFLFAGYARRGLHLAHDAGREVTVTVEVDRDGNGTWRELRRLRVPAAGAAWFPFAAEEAGAWVRLRADQDLARATAWFAYAGNDDRVAGAVEARFAGLAREGSPAPRGGLLHARGGGRRTLALAAGDAYYELGEDLELRRTDEPGAAAWMAREVAIPADAVREDAASVIYTDEAGRRFRLPFGREGRRATGPHGPERACREVCTERDLLNVGGIFYELPAENAGGIAKVRPVATHNLRLHDYATWRGLLLITGVAADAPAGNGRLLRSADGGGAVWAGVVDDLWALGKPVGVGGPWRETTVAAEELSDPYLMTGFDRKTLFLTHRGAGPGRYEVEVDVAGTGLWVPWATVEVAAGAEERRAFPDGFQAYWVRLRALTPGVATARLVYE